jgi:hypothetical protein
VLRIRIRDFLPLDAGWAKKSRSGSEMNIPYHISESLETIFWVKLLKFLDADSGSGNLFDSGIRDPGWKKFEERKKVKINF